MDIQTSVQKIVEQLEERQGRQPLSPKHIWRQDIDEAVEKLEWNDRSRDTSVIALMAGLHVWNDNLHVSHAYCQQIEYDSTGAYWHAIMHRMEQDYPNSKYWFRQAGNHPVKQSMPQKAADYLQQCPELDKLPERSIADKLKQFRDKQSWSSEQFVDLVRMQESGQGSEETRVMLEQLQQIELRALFDYTYQSVFQSDR